MTNKREREIFLNFFRLDPYKIPLFAFVFLSRVFQRAKPGKGANASRRIRHNLRAQTPVTLAATTE